MQRRVHVRSGGFTLVKLFVVDAIAALIAIVLHALNRPEAQAQAMSTQCLSNMRQLGTGLRANPISSFP